jgi:hypothetical protein
VILLGVPYFSDFPGSAAIATLVYGLCCAPWGCSLGN